jgi:succinylglutamic semialdehyde dehydrogenase
VKFNILGNYYSGAFHLPPLTGARAVENIILRHCPAEINLNLWSCPIDYQVVPSVVESASAGFKIWKKIGQAERCNFLQKYQDELRKRQDEIALAIAYEVGKPIWEAKLEVLLTINTISTTIENSLPRIQNKYFENILPETTGHHLFKPLGPSLIIGHYSSPCSLANGQIISSLLAGNSIIFKPSEKTSYAAQLLIECFHTAAFPAGVINLIQGDGEMAKRLLKDKNIRAVFFTGSKEIGKKILEVTHHDLTKVVSLELGGKNTSILHSDANLDYALSALLQASFHTTGQRCTSTAIIAIQRTIHDQFVSRFHDLSKKIIIDHPVQFEREPFMGPLVDQAAVDSYLLFMGMAKREGMQEIMRGKQIERATKGYYVSPSIHIAERWNNDSLFLQSEIYGPNVTFIPYDSIEDAIQIANANEYGLASAIFTRDQALYHLCVEEIDTGTINYNCPTTDFTARLPFGGAKNSGNFRPAALNTIDACVQQVASLECHRDPEDNIKAIKGLDL